MSKFVTPGDAAILGVLYVSKPRGARLKKLLDALTPEMRDEGAKLAKWWRTEPQNGYDVSV